MNTLIPEQGLWSMVVQSSLLIQFIMLVLLIMSVSSWTIIIFKFITFKRFRSVVQEQIENFDRAADLAEAMKSSRQSAHSPLYEIGLAALKEIQKLEKSNLSASVKFRIAEDNVRRVLRQGVSSHLKRLASSLTFLAICANSSLLIGLLGTVWGIMNSFHSIGVQRGATLATVAPGISEALITTAFGLVVAIPATIFYNLLWERLNNIQSDLIDFAGSFLNRAQRELPWMEKK
ncbi:MotA/TolQ/ExbB proton channel family protein [Desulfonatronovibrio magnus]|uniref:MotA/TolQ/ExbB proton channel family protein n=1 Tax=Desulfonatronovibrio magnus TaxID=698827 RepID=UPI0005EB9204|nr:MotA/TolQ/ExbB proton channel family protein [Desulfonatronovibrio magnus]